MEVVCMLITAMNTCMFNLFIIHIVYQHQCELLGFFFRMVGTCVCA